MKGNQKLPVLHLTGEKVKDQDIKKKRRPQSCPKPGQWRGHVPPPSSGSDWSGTPAVRTRKVDTGWPQELAPTTGVVGNGDWTRCSRARKVTGRPLLLSNACSSALCSGCSFCRSTPFPCWFILFLHENHGVFGGGQVKERKENTQNHPPYSAKLANAMNRDLRNLESLLSALHAVLAPTWCSLQVV